MEELERKTEEKMIQKKELRRKIKEKLSFTTEKYRKEADRKITESVLELNEYKSADCVFCYVSTEKEIDTFSILQVTQKEDSSYNLKIVKLSESYTLFNLRNNSLPAIYNKTESPIQRLFSIFFFA